MKLMNLGLEDDSFNDGIDEETLKQDPETDSLAESPLSDLASKSLSNATDDMVSLGRVNEVLEENEDNLDSMPESSQEVMRVAVESIRARLVGKRDSVVSLETFKSKQQLSYAIEENKGVISRAWDAIVKFFKSIYDWIVGLFSKKKNIEKEVVVKAEATLDTVKKAIQKKENKTENSNTPSDANQVSQTVEVVDVNESTVTFTSSKFSRITGTSKLSFNISEIGKIPFTNYFDNFSKDIERSRYGHDSLKELSVILSSSKAKDTMNTMNNMGSGEETVIPLRYEFIDKNLNRGVSVSETGDVTFVYPEETKVEYSVTIGKDYSIEAAEKDIKDIIAYGRKESNKSASNINRIKQELEKVNKALNATKNPAVNKENVSHIIKQTQNILRLHTSIFTDFNKDYDLLLKFYENTVKIRAFN